jgi:L-asparaginase
MADRPKILLLTLGGTISSSMKIGEGVVPSLTAQDLIQKLPEKLLEEVNIKAIHFKAVPSLGLTFTDLIKIGNEILFYFDNEGFDGAVIAQGTDSMEETSFFFHSTIARNQPIVVTGAMRNPTLLGSDSLMNLYHAILVASNEKAKGLGTLVVMNERIHLAPFVQKLHSYALDAFKSPLLGPIGFISEDEVHILLKPINERFVMPLENLVKYSKEPKVALHVATLNDYEELLKSYIQNNFDGLVIEGGGGGHIRPELSDLVINIASRIPVVLCSRTRIGKILKRTYSFKGGEIELLRGGLISGGYLNSLKARVLLYILIKSNMNKEEIKKIFEKYYN